MQTVCVCVWFFKSFYTHVNKPPQCCKHGESRQLDWPLTSGVTYLYAGKAFGQWDHGMHSCALGILIVENGFLKLINNSSRENKENYYRDRGLDMWS